jgi:hypothetical protein
VPSWSLVRYSVGWRGIRRVVNREEAEPTPTLLDPLHAMQFRAVPTVKVSGNDRLGVTVTDRCIPLVTKEKPGCWTRRRAFAQVRHHSKIQLLPYPLVPLLMVRGWHGRRERRGSHLAAAPSPAGRVRPVPGDQCIVGKSPEGSWQIGHQALNLSRSFAPRSRQSILGCLSRSFAVSLSRPVPPCLVC